jgi:hypothetical protein
MRPLVEFLRNLNGAEFWLRRSGLSRPFSIQSSRMLKKGIGVAGTIPLLAQRAASEGPRWTRAVGIIPPTPYKVTLVAALSVTDGGCRDYRVFFKRLDGVLCVWKLADPALMRIRLNIVRRGNNWSSYGLGGCTTRNSRTRELCPGV